jgi:hypothetical protein
MFVGIGRRRKKRREMMEIDMGMMGIGYVRR